MKNGEQKDLGCDGKGKQTILVKLKKFREPAKMFIQCSGCAKCQSHLTKRAPDALRAHDMGEVAGVKLTYVNGNVFATPAKRR